jgi:hypothetical protein
MAKHTGPRKSVVPVTPLNLDGLLDQLRALILQARQQALRAVDVVQVRTCWEMGRHIVECEQGGAERAQYGARLLPRLAERLTAEFGKGFDASNLRYMRLFYQAFPNCDALRHELSWTHYRLLLKVEDRRAREWYMVEAATQNWGTRALERQIGTLYYERLLASKDRSPVREEANRNIEKLEQSTRDFVRDPVLKRGPDDNPTVGIILCSRKDASLVHYSVLQGSEQLFASKYVLVLPTEEELRAELECEQRIFESTAAYVPSPKMS